MDTDGGKGKGEKSGNFDRINRIEGRKGDLNIQYWPSRRHGPMFNIQYSMVKGGIQFSRKAVVAWGSCLTLG